MSMDPRVFGQFPTLLLFSVHKHDLSKCKLCCGAVISYLIGRTTQNANTFLDHASGNLYPEGGRQDLFGMYIALAKNAHNLTQ